MFGRAKAVNQSFDWVGYGLSLVAAPHLKEAMALQIPPVLWSEEARSVFAEPKQKYQSWLKDLDMSTGTHFKTLDSRLPWCVSTYSHHMSRLGEIRPYFRCLLDIVHPYPRQGQIDY